VTSTLSHFAFTALKFKVLLLEADLPVIARGYLRNFSRQLGHPCLQAGDDLNWPEFRICSRSVIRQERQSTHVEFGQQAPLCALS
jgi:hypothetical protein